VFEAGGFVFFSGITGVHPDQSVASDPPTQFRDVFQFIGMHLRAANLRFEHIVDLTLRAESRPSARHVAN
jgi:enamine deaminase RidA (YjgF/YER057c/UK114 family)